jgi:glycosyltransferase involved in cell wall biosynthesis/MoaA/NifB/PqqE/SkfB family radical SAM enzyme
MRIVHVIHGYPLRYNAGSEVYTQNLCRAQAARHEVHVFTREEDPFRRDFAVKTEADAGDPRVALHVVNVARSRDRYRHAGVDQRFAELIDRVHPDVVHIGHLNHLSTSLVHEASSRGLPIVFTLHDFWLMCPRGQFMQMQADDAELWAACDRQDDEKCARRCYARYFSGAEAELSADVDHWKGWVARRMQHVREMAELVDVFVAPSEYLLGRFQDEYGLPATKLVHMDYGFDRARLAGRRRLTGEPFTFGYIGTHIPAKGVQLLLEAFGRIDADARLRIWGRPRGQETEALRALAARLPHDAGRRVEWLPEYENEHITRDVLDRVDAIVVPSIWVENSPLVIHEALQARVPVITANVGGMAELVLHELNGLLFEFRDAASLARQMGRIASEPSVAAQLGARGYLASTSGDVIDIGEHAAAIERLYADVIARRDSARVASSPGPWRVTFDTNPDSCNLKCVMCEEHSDHSLLQVRRKEAGKPRRVMPIELVRKVIADAAPHGLREVIPSTMGEPLLYDDFEEIINLVREYGVKLNLTTNGTFPRLGARAWAELIVPVTSDVKISWNGATAETHEKAMVGTRWESVLENVRTFIAVRDAHAAAGGDRCRVTFQLTFLETNVAELADIVRLAASLGVDRVKGHHLWVHFAEIEQLSMRRSPEAVRRWNAAVLEARAAADAHQLPSGRAVLLENIFLLHEDAPADIAPDGACPFLGQEAWVSAEGRFDPCCAPDAQRRTLGEFGSLHHRGLLEIWRSEPYRSLVAGYRTRTLCTTCTMRRPVSQ